ncbi:hypothetical protein M422DRAFT_779362 [Sphaerobolus stellatus SS14]|uniref:Enoyl reductase (ER) domain-containing protein n=1 Tax=Sphaerobolus stellatus (strain SS14) TaxID=990650 RepID=A0A0C9VBA2_SPHS4|nr:hypothetical protein M422DRAFT_779362 [Sphaerobolus stellatus SS14]
MSSETIPATTRALVVEQSPEERSPAYHDAKIVERPIPKLKDSEVLVKMGALAFNHRDHWIRKNQYPGVAFGAVFGADGAGTIIASGQQNDPLLHRRVFLTPSRGWKENPVAPEQKFAVIGGVKWPAIGTFADYVVVERDEVIETPPHLDDEHAAAWPLAGVTAWRALTQKGQVHRGDNILITGIGGGVAIIALQLAIAMGANVYVTSGSQEKLDKAISIGAKAGFNYKSDTWSRELGSLLKEQNIALDVVIDSAGGDILSQTSRLMKSGGRLVVYGMTIAPKISYTMREVLANIELKGTSMGSRRELVEATEFISTHKIVPVVSEILNGLESVEEGFELMKKGSQFGKIVVKLYRDPKGRL